MEKQDTPAVVPELILDTEETEAEAVLRFAAGRMAALGYVADTYVQAVLDREKEYPTGLEGKFGGFAIPHTFAQHCLRPAVCLVRCRKDVRFVRMDDHSASVDCKLVAMLSICDPQKQLPMLRKLMKLMQNEALMTSLLTQTDTAAAALALGQALA